jgi:hypothetical protein
VLELLDDLVLSAMTIGHNGTLCCELLFCYVRSMGGHQQEKKAMSEGITECYLSIYILKRDCMQWGPGAGCRQGAVPVRRESVEKSKQTDARRKVRCGRGWQCMELELWEQETHAFVHAPGRDVL